MPNLYECTQHCQTNQAYGDWQFWNFLNFPFTFVHFSFPLSTTSALFFPCDRDTKNVSSLPRPPRLSYCIYSILIGNAKFGVQCHTSSHTNLLNWFQCISSLILQMAGKQLNNLNQPTKNNRSGTSYLTVIQDVKLKGKCRQISSSS